MEIKTFVIKNYIGSQNPTNIGGVFRFYNESGEIIKTNGGTYFNSADSDGNFVQYLDTGKITSTGGIYHKVRNNPIWAVITNYSEECTNNSNSGAYASNFVQNAEFRYDFYEPYNISKIEINFMSRDVSGTYGVNCYGADITLITSKGIEKTFTISQDPSNTNEIIELLLDEEGIYDCRTKNFKTNVEGRIITNINQITNIQSISGLQIDCNEIDDGKIRFAISTDDKQTWNVYRNNSWFTIQENNILDLGNTKSELEAINLTTFKILFGDSTEANKTLDILVGMITHNEEISPSISKISIKGIY